MAQNITLFASVAERPMPRKRLLGCDDCLFALVGQMALVRATLVQFGLCLR